MPETPTRKVLTRSEIVQAHHGAIVWIAWLEDRATVFATGDSESEAVGELVRRFPQEFGLEKVEKQAAAGG